MTPPGSRPPIADLDSARALFAGLARARHEAVAIAYLDPQWSILGERHLAGSLDQVRVPIRLVVRDALAFDAYGVLLAHNHPSGDPTPSARDLAFTRALALALRTLGIALVDHLVLAGDGATSLRAMGVV